MGKKIIIIIGIILLVLIGTVSTLLYFALAMSNEKQEVEKPAVGNSTLSIDESHITFLLNEIGAYQLHSSVTGKKPIIEVWADDEKFSSDVSGGKITTTRNLGNSPDIRIKTSKKEVVDALLSQNVTEYAKNSVSAGKTNLEIVAGYTELFTKGYLKIYTELTGKSFTGSVVRMFRR